MFCFGTECVGMHRNVSECIGVIEEGGLKICGCLYYMGNLDWDGGRTWWEMEEKHRMDKGK